MFECSISQDSTHHRPVDQVIDRFRGQNGERRLRDALREQTLVCDDSELAAAILAAGSIEELVPSQPIIRQGGAENDLFLIVAGEVSIQVNGREIARRFASQHVGELAVIDPSAPRAAAVVAVTPGIAIRINEADFSDLAARFPVLWRRIAKALGVRLRERNGHISIRRETPTVFVGSSKEGLRVARAIQAGLRHDHVVVRIWTDGVFGASRFPLEDLEAQVVLADFAVLVATPDDIVSSRGATNTAPRDNVVFELGLFMGALSRRRTVVVQPQSSDLKLPTDLLGMTSLTYNDTGAETLADSIAPVCHDLRQLISRLGAK